MSRPVLADEADRESGRGAWPRPVPLRDRAHNLPIQLTSFVGRDDDIAELRKLLAGHRLVTVVGFGGVGKTRLAIEVAGGLLDAYLDGVRCVELAALADPALIARTVASALDLAEQPGRPIQDVLESSLRTREMLLVLDNCEHLIDGCAALAERLLRACPDLRILATSREALSVGGEMIWPISPLEHPAGPLSAREAEEYGAVRLLAERSRIRKPDFAVNDDTLPAVVEICRRLDGIPLAIELAAAWIPTLTIQELAERLDNRFRLFTGGSRTALPRHQTLRALVDWSYDRLALDEQAVLRALSVFAGGWSLAAAETVVGTFGASGGAAPDAPDTLEVLGRLVAKSLVVVGEQDGATRYRFLETIRQYAAEKLTVDEALAVRRGHAAYFTALSEESEPRLRGADQRTWLVRLDADRDNLRAALRWSIEQQDAETALRICGTLWRYWWIRASLDEGSRWQAQALAISGEVSDQIRAAALNGAGALCRLRGEYEQSTGFHAEALALLRKIDDRRGVAATLQNLASTAKDRGAFVEAEALYTQSLARFREIGDDWGIALAVNNLGISLRGLRQYDRAAALCEEALTIRRARGDAHGIAMSLMELSRISRARRNPDRAAELAAEALPIVESLGVTMHVAAGLEVMAWVAGARGEHTRAARLFGAADGLRSEISAPVPLHEKTDHAQAVAHSRTSLGPGRFAAAFAEGRLLSPREAVHLALTGEAEPKAKLDGPALSRREREVVSLLARGLSNKQLADALVVSQLTAASHVRNILRKLGLDRRGQVAAWAAEHGITASD